MSAVLHEAKAPRLDALGQPAIAPWVRQGDAQGGFAGERHALPKEPLVDLEGQVGQSDPATRPDAGLHLGHVGVDVVPAQRAGSSKGS